jgi:FixJ family two-component response regulator
MKIILLTGFGDLLAAVNDQPDSVDLVLNKPVSRAELRQALEQIEKNDIPAEPV